MSRQLTRGLPYRCWPAADQALWCRLTRQAGFLDCDGPLAHLRPASLETMRTAYGFFLSHALQLRPETLNSDPADRASLDVLRLYHQSMDGLAPRTRSGYFAALYRVFSAAYPERDWSYLCAAKQNLHRIAEKAGGVRDKTRLPPATEIVELGNRLLEQAGSVRRQAELVRDGTMLLLLIYCPLRIANFAGLEMGRTLLLDQTACQVRIPSAETKSKRSIHLTMTPQLSSLLCSYVLGVRLAFPRGSDPQSGHLWLRYTYGHWGKKGLSRHISRLTQAGLGQRLTPHMFRDVAATTVSVSEDIDAGIIRALLGHTDARTAETHYIQSGQLEVGRAYQETLSSLAKRG